jgi:hypothetical protein
MKMLVAGRIFLAIRIFSEHEFFYESFVLQEPSIIIIIIIIAIMTRKGVLVLRTMAACVLFSLPLFFQSWLEFKT